MENEIKTNEREQAQALGLLNAKDVVVSVVKVTADGVSIKLWPDADAVRGVLGEVAQLAQVPGGYSLRRYVCGRALYCAVQLGDATRDAPCPAGYHVHSDANLNEADGSLIAAAAEWGIGKGVFDLPPLRISAGKVHIVPKAKDGTNVIERYILDDVLTLDDITYNDDESVAALRVSSVLLGMAMVRDAIVETAIPAVALLPCDMRMLKPDCSAALDCHEVPGYIVHHKQHITPLTINDPDVTLNWNNLQYVCKHCHDVEHGYCKKTSASRVQFDADGNPLPSPPVRARRPAGWDRCGEVGLGGDGV